MNQAAIGLTDDQYVIGTYTSSVTIILSNGNLRLIAEMLTVVFDEGVGHVTYPYKSEFVLPNARLITGRTTQDGTIIGPAKLFVDLPDTGEMIVVEIDQVVTLAKVRLTRKTKRQMARGAQWQTNRNI